MQEKSASFVKNLHFSRIRGPQNILIFGESVEHGGALYELLLVRRASRSLSVLSPFDDPRSRRQPLVRESVYTTFGVAFLRRGAQKRVGRGAVTPRGIYAIRMAFRLSVQLELPATASQATAERDRDHHGIISPSSYFRHL